MRKKDNQNQQPEQPAYGSYGSYQMTEEQIKQALKVFGFDLLQDTSNEMAGNLLCVLRAFTYATDSLTRENMLIYAEDALLPHINYVRKAVDGLAIEAHKALIQEGGRA